jgi:hypothetical protein
MSNGGRHAIGAVAGLVATPLMVVALAFGFERFGRFWSYGAFMGPGGSERWYAAPAVLFVAVVLGLLAGTRISPLASLIPGVIYTVVGLVWVFAPRFSAEHFMDAGPDSLRRGASFMGPYGLFLLMGVFLLVASLPRSRWAAVAPRRWADAGGPRPHEFGGMAPPYGQVPGPGQAPGPHGRPPGPPPGMPGQPQAPYQQPGPGAPPPAYSPPAYAPPPPAGPEQRPAERKDEAGGDEAGGWTQMYGSGGTGDSGKDDKKS